MATRLHNISGELTQELLAAGGNTKVSSISLTNARAFLSGVAGASSTCKVDLYIEKKLTGKFYILRNVSLPLDTTLTHDFTMDNTANEFGLYMKLTRGDTFTLTGTIDPAASKILTYLVPSPLALIFLIYTFADLSAVTS